MSDPQRTRWSQQERSILELLDGILQSHAVRDQIQPIVRRAAQQLAAEPTSPMAFEPVPLAVYGESLPSFIRSSWVFLLRAGATTGAERHPNSHQRMVSFQGAGDLQVGGEGRWQSNPLISNREASVDQRWVSIPTNHWHQAVVPDDDWVVVSFHTVSAEQLIEERPDAAHPGLTHQRRYLGGAG